MELTIMNAITTIYGKLTHREEGQTMAEYALILAGIAVVVLAGIAILGPAINARFVEIAGDLA